MRKCIVPCCLLLMMLRIALAGPDDQRNAATWYSRAFAEEARISEADWDLIWDYWDNPDQEPPPGLREVMAKARPIIENLRRGAAQEYADYNLNYSEGFELLLPHLGRMRTVSKIMRADIMLRLHDGDTYGAADRIATLYRMADHSTDDGILISSLVGAAIFQFSDNGADIGFQRAVFGPRESELMLRSLQGLDERDPFRMTEAMFGEKALAVDWLTNKYGSAEARQNAESLWEMFSYLDHTDRFAEQFAGLSDEGFAQDIQQYSDLMDRAVEAFHMNDPEQASTALKQLEEEIGAGEHGFLAAVLAMSFSHVYEQMQRSSELVQKRREFLEGIIIGEVEPDAAANAAIYYVRGIEAIRKIDAESFEAVCAIAKTGPGPIDETPAATLTEAQEIVALFREGSEKRRCDFEYLRDYARYIFCPDYVAGMQDAFRLLHADAIRLIEAGDADAAADRLAICYRIVGHLSGDEPLLSTLVAHRAFDRTDALIAQSMDEGLIEDPHRASLLDAAERIGRSDPFGHIASVMAARKTFISALSRWPPGSEEEQAYLKTQAEAIETWTGDQLLFVFAIYDTMARAEKSPAEIDGSKKPDLSVRLDGVWSLSELAKARNMVNEVAPLLAQEAFDRIMEREFPRFARMDERMRSARADLRSGLARLRPPKPLAEEPATTRPR